MEEIWLRGRPSPTGGGCDYRSATGQYRISPTTARWRGVRWDLWYGRELVSRYERLTDAKRAADHHRRTRTGPAR